MVTLLLLFCLLLVILNEDEKIIEKEISKLLSKPNQSSKKISEIRMLILIEKRRENHFRGKLFHLPLLK